jgi:hypothetical protein
MKIRRYLLAALIAETIALGFYSSSMHNAPAALWRQAQIYNSVPHSDVMPIQYADSEQHIFEWQHKETKLSEQAHALALLLDFLDSSPLLLGFPAIAVLALWTFDRRRKQKPRESPV